jgi:MFS family permease
LEILWHGFKTLSHNPVLFQVAFKMIPRRQGEGDAGVRWLYIEEPPTQPTKVAFECDLELDVPAIIPYPKGELNKIMDNDKITLYPYRWIVITSFALLNAVVQMNWIAFAPVTTQAAAFYKVSEMKIGLLSMSYMIVYLVVCLPASYIIDVWGLKKGIGIGAALTGLFGFLRGIYGSDYTMVMLSQFGLAVAQPFVLNALTAVSASWFPVEERATAAGIPIFSMSIGIILAMACTPLITESRSIPDMLFLYGVVSVVIAVLFLLFMKEKPPCPPGRIEEKKIGFFTGIGDVLKNRDMRLMLLSFFIGLGIFNAITTWIEQVLHSRGFSAVQAGMAGAVMMISGIFGTIVFPLFSDRLRKRKSIFMITVAGAIPGLAGLTFGTDYTVLLVSAAILGFFSMGGGPIGYQYCAEISFPVPEATSQGLIILSGQISGIVFIVGMDVSKNVKTGDMFMFMAIFIVLSVVNLIICSMLKESKMIKQA